MDNDDGRALMDCYKGTTVTTRVCLKLPCISFVYELAQKNWLLLSLFLKLGVCLKYYMLRLFERNLAALTKRVEAKVVRRVPTPAKLFDSGS